MKVMKNKPFFSVVIPTKDRPEYLREALLSVLLQSYKNYEIIVVNDGGKDVKHVIDELKVSNITYLEHATSKGPAAARNTAIKNANGNFIAFLDDDDIYYKNHLEVAATNLDDETRVLYTLAVRASFRKKENDFILVHTSVPYNFPFEFNRLQLANFIPTPTLIIEKKLIEEVGYFNESYIALEDWELLIRLADITPFQRVLAETVQVNWRVDKNTITFLETSEFIKSRERIERNFGQLSLSNPNREKYVQEFMDIWNGDIDGSTPKCSVIVVTYNQLDYTKLFLESVKNHTHVPYELIIVDNNSQDETKEFLTEYQKDKKQVRVLFNEKNVGFPAAVNQGIKASKGLYVVIINNDVVVTPNWFRKLIEAAETDASIGIVGPMSNSVSGAQLDKEAAYGSIEEMYAYAEQQASKHEGEAFLFPRVAFLCTLLKREVINRLGGLDERFSPGNYEDDDYCLRAELAGFKVAIRRDLFIHHFGSKSFKADGDQQYYDRLRTNRAIFVDKWGYDPDEIWLKGEKPRKRNGLYPLSHSSFREALSRAYEHIQENEYELAHYFMKKGLDEMHKWFLLPKEKGRVYHLAGLIALQNQDTVHAIECFKEELQYAEVNAKIYELMGDAYCALNQTSDGRQMYEIALQIENNNITVREKLKNLQ